jgi:hypothetical protein
MPRRVSFNSAAVTSREACPTLTGKALAEGLEMLARQQRRRHDNGNLLAAHHRNEGRPQRHLGLAETDIAADQAVHRRALGQVVQRRVDGVELVLGFLIGEAGAEFVIGAGLDRKPGCGVQLARGGDLEQFVRHLADATLHPRLARLPGAAAEPVQLDLRFLRAVAREQFDILHRQEQLVAAGIMQFEAIVRRARRLHRLQPDKAADAVVHMHHEVACRQAGRLGDEILRPARGAARAHHAVAEDVLFADDCGRAGFKSGFEAEHRQRDLRLGLRLRLRP